MVVRLTMSVLHFSSGRCPDDFPFSITDSVLYGNNPNAYGDLCCSELSAVMETEEEYYPCAGDGEACPIGTGCEDSLAADAYKSNLNLSQKKINKNFY